RRGCTASTREQILEDLRSWTNDLTSAKVFWMNGMAGTGKTTILYSFCQWLEDNSRLGGNFFCSRSSTSCRSLNKILPSLAYQLAHYSPAFRSQLCTVLEDHQSPQTLNVGSQFKWVIETPFEKSKEAIPEGVVIVIDALDECENASEMRLFLETLLKCAGRLPVKFVIASRPEPIIVTKVQSPGFSPSTIHLHDIEAFLVEADIRKYLKEALSTMYPIPSLEQIGQITERSGKLFIYAATVARYINPEDPTIDSSGRLETILGNASDSVDSNLRYNELDTLYLNIVSSALADRKLEPKELDIINLILRTVVCAMEPLTIKTMSTMLAVDQVQIKKYISRLHSVLHVQQGDTGQVSVLHASFPDFLFDESRSHRFHCDSHEYHAKLSSFCFDVMEKELRFNICGLETSFLFDSDVPDLQQKIERNISDALFYSCKHWGNHLIKGNFAEVIHTKLIYFLETHLLFWMEVLNVKRRMMTGTKLLSNVLIWLKSTDTKKKLYNSKEFVEAFSMSACSKSTPHIYISALPFCYKSNFVYENYWTKTQGLIGVNGSSVEEKRSRPIATWHMGYGVESLASSHNGTSFATGSYDGVRFHDADSGEIIAGPFAVSGRDEFDADRHVTFSLDNTKLASVCHDETCIWDVQTGNLIAGPLQRHMRFITSLSFSPDSKKLVSGDAAGTIIVWDSVTGDVISGPFQSTDAVKVVGFTSDGFKIVSASAEHSIFVWDAEKGTILSGCVAAIGDEHGRLISAALSSDRSNIAMGFYRETISIVDASTGAVVIGPFTCNKTHVSSLVYSPDGRAVAAGLQDGCVGLWDVQTGKEILHPFQAYKNNGNVYISFSPNDANLVTGFAPYHIDDPLEPVRIWDAQTGKMISELLTGPWELGTVDSLTYSHDGSKIAWSMHHDIPNPAASRSLHPPSSSSFEEYEEMSEDDEDSKEDSKKWRGGPTNTIRIWDLRSGRTIGKPMQGHIGGKMPITFSPDDTILVSGSRGELIMWSVDACKVIWRARLKPTGDSVTSMAFSLDGTRFASGSSDGQLRLWNTTTRKMIPLPWRGRSQHCITCIAFLSDGHKVLTASNNGVICLQDVETGHILGKFSSGGSIRSVAVSPDCSQIAAYEGAIRMWEVE
ncbi:YVTN repeat-like/Quino protein amine dehydrogenase, partial [Agrocybe pediades]